MTGSDDPWTVPPIASGFPQPPGRLRLAYREIDLAANGTEDQRKALGDPTHLVRPWLVSSFTDLDQLLELKEWLSGVVMWLTSEYCFAPEDVVPPCWWQHRHLVHELAVLADQRYRAELSLTSDLIEDWHRWALPAFQDRARSRIGQSCASGHAAWPAAARYRALAGEGSSMAAID